MKMSKKIKAARSAAMLSQSEAAVIAETSQSKISQIENESSGIDFREVEKIVGIIEMFAENLSLFIKYKEEEELLIPKILVPIFERAEFLDYAAAGIILCGSCNKMVYENDTIDNICQECIRLEYDNLKNIEQTQKCLDLWHR